MNRSPAVENLIEAAQYTVNNMVANSDPHFDSGGLRRLRAALTDIAAEERETEAAADIDWDGKAALEWIETTAKNFSADDAPLESLEEAKQILADIHSCAVSGLESEAASADAWEVTEEAVDAACKMRHGNRWEMVTVTDGVMNEKREMRDAIEAAVAVMRGGK